jgi:uncharacterized protein
MNAPHIVPIYAAMLALIFIALSGRTLRLRRKLKIGLGDAGDQRMLRAMRVHANFAEYVPLSLLLILLVELQGTRVALVHALGLALLFARLAHAYGVSQAEEPLSFRIVGIVLTFMSISASALVLILNSVV